MTQAEQASLERLADRVDAGFLEVRQLMEARRVEEVRVQGQLESRLRKVERVAWGAGVAGTAGMLFIAAIVNHTVH